MINKLGMKCLARSATQLSKYGKHKIAHTHTHMHVYAEQKASGRSTN